MSPNLRSIFAQVHRKSRSMCSSSRNFSSVTRSSNASNGGGARVVPGRGTMVSFSSVKKLSLGASMMLGYFFGVGFDMINLFQTLLRLHEEKNLLSERELETEAKIYELIGRPLKE